MCGHPLSTFCCSAYKELRNKDFKMKKAEIKPDEKQDNAAETLEQIMGEWVEQQRRKRFEKPTATLCRKQNSDSFSVFYIFKSFMNVMCKKRRFCDVLGKLCLYIFRIAKFLAKFLMKKIKFLMKKIKNAFVCLIEFILKVEKV